MRFRKLGGLSLVFPALVARYGIAGATTLTFDDLPIPAAPGGIGSVPVPYDGLNLTCGGVSSCQVIDYVTYQSALGVPSGYQGAAQDVAIPGTNVLSTAYDAGPDSLKIAPAAGGTFDFNSAYLTAAWRDGMNISLVGYNGSTSVDTANLVLGNAGVPTYESLNWNNVTSVVITASGGSTGPYRYQTYELAVSDLTYNASPVPLPAAAWLMLSGLGGLVAVGRKRRPD
jgi:hypothetical protein